MTNEAGVRVRYAPSPTGEPHVGNIRQALFNWLLARSQGGTFILRIEDTDRNRFVPTAVQSQIDALKWLGLDWDEGPDVGGEYGPYNQSERLPFYHEAALRLLEGDQAYHCFCTPERLDALRNHQRELKVPPGYDGRCRTPEGRQEAQSEVAGAAPVVRFAMPREGETVVRDFLRGEVTFKNALIDDFVLLKSDGFPTYHLAEAVDDFSMDITHVIRNEEWLPSLPRHHLLFEALGFQQPVFIHTASILGADRSKLSKRHGAQSVLEYRDMGYLSEAVFNFLALLGWSLDDKTEIISRTEFVYNFSIERLIKSPAVFDIDKLNWMNGTYMRATPVETLAQMFKDWLEKPEDEGGLPPQVERPVDFEFTKKVTPLVQERVKLLPEARDMLEFFFLPGDVEPDADLLLGKAFAEDRTRAVQLLSEALVASEELEDWMAELIEARMRALAEQQDVKARDLFMLLRTAITGRSVAPPLFESMELVGKDRCVYRLRVAVNSL